MCPTATMLAEDLRQAADRGARPVRRAPQLRRITTTPACAPSSTASASTTSSSRPPTATASGRSTRCCGWRWSGSTRSRRSCCRRWARSGGRPIRRSCRSAPRPAGCCRFRPWSGMSIGGTIVFARRGRDADRGSGHRRPCQDAVAPGLGHALDGAGRRLRDVRQGPDRLASGLSNQVCRVLGGEPPEGFHYELFMDENNQKISKSKGNGLTMEDWLRYGAPESLAYYMFQSPRSAKRLYLRRHPQGGGRISAAAGRLQPPARRGRRQRGQPAGQPGLARPCAARRRPRARRCPSR